MTEPLQVIGIDPGLTGAIAILPLGKIYDTPTVKAKTGQSGKNAYLPIEMAALLQLYRDGRAHVVIEKQQAFPQQSVYSIGSIMEGYGIWEGIIGAFRMPVTVVRPPAWKKVMLQGTGKDKGASLKRAQEQYPGLSHYLTRQKDHNRAEALLLAAYGLKELAL